MTGVQTCALPIWVDFDPNGERNPQNRGKSGYVRISWDEALDIVATEIKRQKRLYGPGSITFPMSSHHQWGNVGYYLSSLTRFANLIGFTRVAANPDSWEGWYWGAMHHFGNSMRIGVPAGYGGVEECLREAETIVFWSSDPETTNAAYAGFEGTIPKGNYGAGTVEIWDRGTWAPLGENDPARALAEGELKFTLAGERLRGGFVLVRMKPSAARGDRSDADNWLLIKEHDPAAREGEDAAALEASVKPAPRRPAASLRATTSRPKRAASGVEPPVGVAPQLARMVAHAPEIGRAHV